MRVLTFVQWLNRWVTVKSVQGAPRQRIGRYFGAFLGETGSDRSGRLAVLSMLEKISIHEDTHLKVLRMLEVNPRMNQRELAQALGVSLGKTNYCLKALLDKGLLKIQNFQSSKRKLAYAYLLTPAGISAKSAITARFLQCKIKEYELLKAEIEALQQQGVEGRPNRKRSPLYEK